jgi:hypothetical protein
MDDIDKIANVPGFALAMCAKDVGWLVSNNEGITFPRWDKYNSDSAKKREYERLKKRQQRKLRKKSGRSEMSPDCPPKKEGHFGDSPSSPLFLFSLLNSPLPDPLNKDVFRIQLDEWLNYKRERDEDYTDRGLKAMISHAAKMAGRFGLQAVCDAMEKAISRNWKGWDQEGSFQANGGASRVGDPRGNLAVLQKAMEKINAE